LVFSSTGHEIFWQSCEGCESLAKIAPRLAEHNLAAAPNNFNFIDLEAEILGQSNCLAIA
jgi:hypothetical protein